MLKIVIDTNVIVSALIGGSYPSRIIKDIVLDKKVIVCLSHAVFSEYVNVVNREKFKKYTSFVTNAEIVLNKIDQISLKFVPGFQLETIKDEADNRFLELALAANADFLITGNTKDFTMKNIETLKIVTPEEFINAIKL
jgi:putative PIN family toxin of toxin-antitoxin system